MTRLAQRARILAAAFDDVRYFTPSGYQRDRNGVLVHPWQDVDPRAGTEPQDFSLDRQLATARAEIGEERWAELQKDWNNG